MNNNNNLTLVLKDNFNAIRIFYRYSICGIKIKMFQYTYNLNTKLKSERNLFWNNLRYITDKIHCALTNVAFTTRQIVILLINRAKKGLDILYQKNIFLPSFFRPW